MKAPFQGSESGGRPPRDKAAAAGPAALAQVRAYWEALREEGGVPLRSQIDPRGMESALTAAFLAEQVAPGIARFRIAGSCFTDLAAMDVRGMPVSALFAPSAREALKQAMAQVFALPARLELGLEAERGIGRPALEARLLMLPLRDDHGNCSLALGCLALSGETGRRPRRFHITRRDMSPIPADRRDAVLHPAAGFAESRAQFVPPRAVPGRPHLRLVKTDA